MNSAETIFTNLPDRRGTGSFKWDFATDTEIPLWVADMDFPVAPAITAALHARLQHPIFGYSAVPKEYPQAFGRWQRERNGWEIEEESLLVVPSTMQALAVAIEAFTAPGDVIGVFSPVYFPFFDAIEELDRTVLRVPLAIENTNDGAASRYVLDLDLLRRRVGELSMLLLCSPHNPGGRVWSAEELSALREITENAGVRVVSDEIHSDLVFPNHQFVPWLKGDGGSTEGVGDIALLAPSKTFNIPGLPTAWAVIPDTVTRERYAAALHARMHKLSNLLTMEAALAAYRDAAGWLDTVRSQLLENFQYLQKTVDQLEGVSVFSMEGTFIAWIDLRERWRMPHTDRFSGGYGRALEFPDLSQRFGNAARENGVWLSDGSQFGPEGNGFMRLNFATSPELLDTGLQRFIATVDSFDPIKPAGTV